MAGMTAGWSRKVHRAVGELGEGRCGQCGQRQVVQGGVVCLGTKGLSVMRGGGRWACILTQALPESPVPYEEEALLKRRPLSSGSFAGPWDGWMVEGSMLMMPPRAWSLPPRNFYFNHLFLDSLQDSNPQNPKWNQTKPNQTTTATTKKPWDMFKIWILGFHLR